MKLIFSLQQQHQPELDHKHQQDTLEYQPGQIHLLLRHELQVLVWFQKGIRQLQRQDLQQHFHSLLLQQLRFFLQIPELWQC